MKTLTVSLIFYLIQIYIYSDTKDTIISNYIYNTNKILDYSEEINKGKLLLDKYKFINKNLKIKIFNRIGFFQYKNNNYNNAILFYNKAYSLIKSDINTNNIYILNNIGISYYKLSKYKKAVIFFKKYLKVKKTAKVYFNLSLSYLFSGKYTLAYNNFKKALKTNMNYVLTRYDKKKAEKTITKLKKERPNDKEIVEIEKYVKKHK